MSRRARRQDGWVLPSAITLLAIMMTMSLAVFTVVDTGQERGREQRERESSLNLTEGVLYAQGFTLAQGWPGTAAAAIPASCTEASSTPGCPRPSNLAAAQGGSNFANVDQSAGVTWVTRVRDNGGPLEKDYVTAQADQPQTVTKTVNGQSVTTTCAGPCRWDHNGDKQMWVQARSIVRGKPRNVVALLRLETLREATPETAVVAGGINVSNNGNKTMIQANGSQVVVRCNNVNNSNCVDWDSSPVPQIVPPPVSGNPGNLMSADQLERFRLRAVSDGTYYAGCPDGSNLWGKVVFIDNCPELKVSTSTLTAPCNPQAPPVAHGGGNQLDPDCVNQLSEPGVLIMHCGKLDFSGGFTYVGVVYAANNSDGTCANPPFSGQRGGNCNVNGNHVNNLITISGGFGVWGALAIDGPGCLHAGSNAVQVQYDANVFSAVASYGTVGLVQNTWRELPPS